MIARIREVGSVFGGNKGIFETSESADSVVDVEYSIRARGDHPDMDIAAVHKNLAKGPGTSILHIVQKLDILTDTLCHILTVDLQLHDYKM